MLKTPLCQMGILKVTSPSFIYKNGDRLICRHFGFTIRILTSSI